MGLTILITGAAGNLGSLLARHLLDSDVQMRLMVQRTPLPEDLQTARNATQVKADLAHKETLVPAVEGADVVVHSAGVLFAARPAKFLPETNTQWFADLVEASVKVGVKRVVLISFPHVEGPTSMEHPATGRLDGHPPSVHARTRLEEERLLFRQTEGTGTIPVVLRLGMVFGQGILMVEAAKWLARRRQLAVWKQPTWIHLISTADYLEATAAAALRPGVSGIYHIGDEEPVTVQYFLDEACGIWQLPKPPRFPLWMVYAAAILTELQALVLATPAPLTRDFITIGRVSYYGDTRRAREDLIPVLKYPNLGAGLTTL